MGIMISHETLRRFPFFAGVDLTLLMEIAKAGEELHLKRKKVVFREGDKAASFYIILDGEVEIRVPLGSRDHYKVAISQLIAGDILGWESLVEPYKHTVAAVVTKDAKLAKINAVHLSELMIHNPHLGYKLMSRTTRIIGERYRDLQIRFVSLIEGGRWQRLSISRSMVSADGGSTRPEEISVKK